MTMLLRRVPTLLGLGKRAFHVSTLKRQAFSPSERTFVMVKPDGLQRGKVGKIITRYEERGFRLVGIKIMCATEDIIKAHYAEHVNKKFFPHLQTFLTSGPVVPMVWEGKNAVNVSRSMIGLTDPMKSNSGTIRGDYALDLERNIVHGAGNTKEAENEMNIWFKKEELASYTSTQHVWVYSD